MKCSDCGSLNIDFSDALTVCMDCGDVLNETHVVSEVQFEKTNNGINAVGQFLSSDSQANFKNLGSTFMRCMKQPHREITQLQARNDIQVLSNILNLKPQTLENACTYYNLALKNQYVQGRKKSMLYGASIYTACRLDGTMHMLSDVADASNVDVLKMGKTYLKMKKLLALNIPDLDPSIFLLRFVHSLDFRDKTNTVFKTAMRILQVMKKNWITTGKIINETIICYTL